MKKTLIVALLLTMLGMAASVHAEYFSFDLNKSSLSLGDTVKTVLVAINRSGNAIKGELYFSYLAEKQDYPPAPWIEKIYLQPGEQSKAFKFEMRISDGMPAGRYRAQALIKEESGAVIAEEYRNFLIIGTKKTPLTELIISEDSLYKAQKAIFLSGQEIYLKLDRLATNSIIHAFLSGNPLKREGITFKEGRTTLKPLQPGSYNIDIEISHNEYLTQKISRDFAIIDKPAIIATADMCWPDNKCREPENLQNCPQDCAPPASLKAADRKKLYAMVGMLVLLVAGGIVAVVRRRQGGGPGNDVSVPPAPPAT